MSPSSDSVNRLPYSRDFTPSPFVRKCAERMVHASGGRPILDVACGSGRNGLFVASLGCEVVFIDRDLTRLHDSVRSGALQIDLTRDRWPFAAGTLGGIIKVHFLLPRLFPHFAVSLVPGGYLLLETVPGCGNNYLELPEAGRIRQQLVGKFDLEEYRESTVGPSEVDAVTVRLLARKRLG